MQGAITDLFAGVAVSDLDAGIECRITLAVAGLDALLERLAAQRIEHEPIETYSNGVRHVKIPDPDGNAIAFAEPPDAAS
jgi:2-hydroxy-3-keto-5-methylthiopentenyl-1-phosphate phosphatase